MVVFQKLESFSEPFNRLYSSSWKKLALTLAHPQLIGPKCTSSKSCVSALFPLKSIALRAVVQPTWTLTDSPIQARTKPMQRRAYVRMLAFARIFALLDQSLDSNVRLRKNVAEKGLAGWKMVCAVTTRTSSHAWNRIKAGSVGT